MLEAQYFDGRGTRVHRVGLTLAGDLLVITGEEIARQVPFSLVTVDERLGRAARRLRLPDGAFCAVADLEGLDAVLAQAGHRDGRIDRLQRHLKAAMFAAAACILIALATWRWGLPWLAEIGARHMPATVGRTLTAQTLKILDGPFLKPSTLSQDRQADLSQRYRALILPEGGHPTGALLFRASPTLGANAFTLPDGTVILLDGLVDGLGDDTEILAVLAHELGHAHGHHGLQLLLRSSAVGAFWTFYIGDISQLLAAAPTVLMQAHYSRELEQQADDYGAALLEANHLSPALLADALDKLTVLHPGQQETSYLAGHPATAQRIEKLRSR